MKDILLPPESELLINQYPEKNYLAIGLNNPNIVGTDKITGMIYYGKIDDFLVSYNLSVYPFKMMNHVYKETFVLEIDTTESYNAYKRTLPMLGYEQHSFIKFGSACANIANKICALNNFVINEEFCHWPILQYIVSVNKKLKDESDVLLDIISNASKSAYAHNFKLR